MKDLEGSIALSDLRNKYEGELNQSLDKLKALDFLRENFKDVTSWDDQIMKSLSYILDENAFLEQEIDLNEMKQGLGSLIDNYWSLKTYEMSAEQTKNFHGNPSKVLEIILRDRISVLEDVSKFLDSINEIELVADDDGIYRGRGPVSSLDVDIEVLFELMQCRTNDFGDDNGDSGEVLIAINSVPYGKISLAQDTLGRKVSLLYRQVDDGIKILSVCQRSYFELEIEETNVEIPDNEKENIPGLVPEVAETPEPGDTLVTAKTTLPAATSDSMEESTEELTTEFVDQSDAQSTEEVTLMAGNTKLYLTQCLEKHLLEHFIIRGQKKVLLEGVKYSFDEIINYRKVGELLNKKRDSVYEFARKNNLRSEGGMTALNALKVYLLPPLTRKPTDGEIGRQFGIPPQNVISVRETGLFDPGSDYNTTKAISGITCIKNLYFEMFDEIADSIEKGTLLPSEKAESLTAKLSETESLEEVTLAAGQKLEEDEVKGTYDPKALVTDMWVIYRLGIRPYDNASITDARKRIFPRKNLNYVKSVGALKYYRVRSFGDTDFKEWGKTAREVLTNPYDCQRDPNQLIVATDVALELGVGRHHARELLEKTGVGPAKQSTKKRWYRRGEVHDQLNLPGWLPDDWSLPEPSPDVGSNNGKDNGGNVEVEIDKNVGSDVRKKNEKDSPGRIKERASRKPSDRTKPEQLIDYQLTYVGEGFYKASERVVAVYQSEFDKRYLQHLIDRSFIKRNDLCLGEKRNKKYFHYQEWLEISDFTQLWDKDIRAIRKKVHRLPNSLRKNASNSFEISPFAALILYRSFCDRPGETYVVKSDVFEELFVHIDSSDDQLVEFFYKSGLLRKVSGEEKQGDNSELEDAMERGLFSKMYNNLHHNWALCMEDNSKRELLMKNMGFVSEKEAKERLMDLDLSEDRVNDLLASLRGNEYVLGMVYEGEITKREELSK